MATPTFAERFKKIPLTDKHVAKHRALATEERAAYAEEVVQKDGLASAAKAKAVGLMELFLELGIDPDVRSPDKSLANRESALRNVLTWTDGAARRTWVERLLEAGADPGRKQPDPRYINPAIADPSLETPLTAALSWNADDCLDLMLARGVSSRARISAVARNIHSLDELAHLEPERRAALLASASKVLEGVNVDELAFDGATLLHHACERNALAAAHRLLERGADPNVPTTGDRSVSIIGRTLPAGSTALDVIETMRAVHAETGKVVPALDALAAALVSKGATRSGAERPRPPWAAPIDALLVRLIGQEGLELARAKLQPREGTFAFTYLRALAHKVPPASALAPHLDEDPLAYLLHTPSFAPTTEHYPPEEVMNERRGVREWTDVLRKSDYTPEVWRFLEDADLLSRWPRGREGAVLAYDRAQQSAGGPVFLVRVFPDRIEALGDCETLIAALSARLDAAASRPV